MSAQTSYAINQQTAFAGLIYAQAPHDIISRDVETVAGIEFGVAVGRGTDKDTQCVIGTADFLGITIRALDREGVANTGAIRYELTQTAGIIRSGYVWAVCPAGCTAGDPVLYTTATGVLDAGTAGVGEIQLDGAQWDTSAAAGELAVIRIDSAATTVGS